MAKRKEALAIIKKEYNLQNIEKIAVFLLTDIATILYLQRYNEFPPNIEPYYKFLLAARIARLSNIPIAEIKEQSNYGRAVNKERMNAFKGLLFYTQWHTVALFARENDFNYHALRTAINGDITKKELLNKALKLLKCSPERFEILAMREVNYA